MTFELKICMRFLFSILPRETYVKSIHYLDFEASINPHTVKARQVTPGTIKSMFQYGVVKSDEKIAMVTSSATNAPALIMILPAVPRDNAKNKTLMERMSNPSCRQT